MYKAVRYNPSIHHRRSIRLNGIMTYFFIDSHELAYCTFIFSISRREKFPPFTSKFPVITSIININIIFRLLLHSQFNEDEK